MTYDGDVQQLEELTDLLTTIDSPGKHCRSLAALADLSLQRVIYLYPTNASGALLCSLFRQQRMGAVASCAQALAKHFSTWAFELTELPFRTLGLWIHDLQTFQHSLSIS